MSRRIRVGIIGLGFGKAAHLPAFSSDPRFEVAALCAPREEKLAEAARESGVAQTYTRWTDLISDPGIDLVSVAAPTQVQPAILRAAIEARKHVFAEKPLGCGADQARTLAASADRMGVVHAIDFGFRELGLWKRAREILASGELGALRHVTLAWHVEIFAHRANRTDSWKVRRSEGGGTLNQFVSHSLDYLEWLFGRIEALEARFDPEPQAEPEIAEKWVQLAMRTAGGVPISAAVSTHSRLGLGHRLEAQGERGNLVLENPTPDHMGGFRLRLQVEGMASPRVQESLPAPVSMDSRVAVVAGLVRRMGDAILGQGPGGPTLHDGARVEELLERARESARRSWK